MKGKDSKEAKIDTILKAIKGDTEALHRGTPAECLVFMQDRFERDTYVMAGEPGREYTSEEVDEIERRAMRRNPKNVVIKINVA